MQLAKGKSPTFSMSSHVSVKYDMHFVGGGPEPLLMKVISSPVPVPAVFNVCANAHIMFQVT